MKKIFDYESKFMERVSQIGELVWLSLLWLLFSLPVITIGASTCAMYSVCYGMHERENVSTWTSPRFLEGNNFMDCVGIIRSRSSFLLCLSDPYKRELCILLAYLHYCSGSVADTGDLYDTVSCKI